MCVQAERLGAVAEAGRDLGDGVAQGSLQAPHHRLDRGVPDTDGDRRRHFEHVQRLAVLIERGLVIMERPAAVVVGDALDEDGDMDTTVDGDGGR